METNETAVPEKIIPHGTISTYQNHGCRCPECRAANAGYGRKRKMERRSGPPPVHGRESSYSNWGCRCEACTAANAAASRVKRERQRAADAPVTIPEPPPTTMTAGA